MWIVEKIQMSEMWILEPNPAHSLRQTVYEGIAQYAGLGAKRVMQIND